MKIKERKETAASIRLLSIVKSVTGVDPEDRSKRDDLVSVRMIVYKILRDKDQWTYAKMGSLFGKDHATVRHSYLNFDNYVVQDKWLREAYKKILSIYLDKSVETDQVFSSDLSKLIVKRDSEISILKNEIETLKIKLLDHKAESVELRADIQKEKEANLYYAPLFKIIRNKLPVDKIGDAAVKINAVLNGL